MKMLVLTTNHPASKPETYGLMECEVEGSRVSTGDFIAKSEEIKDVLDHLPTDFVEVGNRLIKLVFDKWSPHLFIAEKDLPK